MWKRPQGLSWSFFAPRNLLVDKQHPRSGFRRMGSGKPEFIGAAWTVPRCGDWGIRERGGVMVPVGPQRWQRQWLGDRGDRQPPAHVSTPRNDWGCAPWAPGGEMDPAESRGWGSTWSVCNSLFRLLEQDAGHRFPTSPLCWLRGLVTVFSLPMPLTARPPALRAPLYSSCRILPWELQGQDWCD